MTTSPAARQSAPAVPRPLEVARADLQRELDPRYVQFPSFAHAAGSEPLVVPLGAHDLLGDVVTDPYAMVRSRATVHLTGRAALVGPWGGDACGMCLGLHWQRLRRGPDRTAWAWGHDPVAGEERPVLTGTAVEVIRTVWSTVFGPAAESDDDEPGAPPRVASRTASGAASRTTASDATSPEQAEPAVPAVPAEQAAPPAAPEGVRGPGEVENEPAARVTCVDLRVPVPRTYALLPVPPCGPHTGGRG